MPDLRQALVGCVAYFGIGVTEPSGLERLPRALVAVLAAAIAVQVASTGVSLTRAIRAGGASVPATSLVQPHRAGLSVGERLRTIVGAHLFGEMAQGRVEEKVAPPATWALSGTLAGSTPESGSAIVGESASAARFHAAGEEIKAGFRLLQVFVDRVVIERGGERLTVRLPRGRLAVAGVTVARAAASEVEAPSTGVSDEEYPEDTTRVKTLLRPSPYLVNHHLAGIQLGGGDALQQFGLRALDIVTQVNGRSLDSQAAQQKALKEIMSGSPVVLTVQRDGSWQQVPMVFKDDRD